MDLRHRDARPKTASMVPGGTIWSRSSALSIARPSVSAGRPRVRPDSLTPRPPHTPAYEGPARNVSNPRQDPTSNAHISRASMVKLRAPGTPELKLTQKSRDVLRTAASRPDSKSEFEADSRARSSAHNFDFEDPSDEHDENQRLRRQLAAADRLVKDTMVKNQELEKQRDKYWKLYENTAKQLEDLREQASRSESGLQMLKRDDVTVEKFFELAAKQSQQSARNGFTILGDQSLRGGSGVQSTVQLTVNTLGNRTPSKKRPHTAGYVKQMRPSTGNASVAAAQSVGGVPQPRFWGTGIVEDYTLEDLREALKVVGSTGASHFPRTSRELDGLKAREELQAERKHNQEIWSKGTAMLSELFGHELNQHALPDEIVKAFEEKLPRKLHGDTCIIYFLNQKTNQMSCTSKISKRKLEFAATTGIAEKVQKLRQTVVATELIHLEKDGWKDFNITVEADRVSAVASPCFDSDKRMLAVIEVSSSGRTVQFTRSEKRLLELACVLLVEVMGRTKVAADLAEATEILDTTIDCVSNLSHPNIVEQINQVADKCRALVQAREARVWLMNRKLDELFVNTEDESQVQSCTIGTGFVGGTVHSRLTEARVRDGVAVMCAPIIDRNGEVLGVVEMEGRVTTQRTDWRAGLELQEVFSKRDEGVLGAFCAILANYVEHTQYVQRMRSTLGSIRHAGDEALEAIQASAAIRDTVRQMFTADKVEQAHSPVRHARRSSIARGHSHRQLEVPSSLSERA